MFILNKIVNSIKIREVNNNKVLFYDKIKPYIFYIVLE